MATQYNTLKDYIEQDKHLVKLIPPLVHLAQQEETVIRDEALTLGAHRNKGQSDAAIKIVNGDCLQPQPGGFEIINTFRI